MWNKNACTVDFLPIKLCLIKFALVCRCDCPFCRDTEGRHIWPQASTSFCRWYNFLICCFHNCWSSLCCPSLCSSTSWISKTGRPSASASVYAFTVFQMCYFVNSCFAGMTSMPYFWVSLNPFRYWHRTFLSDFVVLSFADLFTIAFFISHNMMFTVHCIVRVLESVFLADVKQS